MGKNAIVLLSGGLDSATVLAGAVRDGFTVHAVSFDYGQRHRVELERAAGIAAALGAAEHIVVRLDPRPFRRSALTGGQAPPTDRAFAEMDAGIAPTYVPARNTVFLAHALALGEELDARDLFIGVNHIDYSGYPDCRPAFIDAFEKLANLGTSAADGGGQFRVHAPLIDMSKARIAALAVKLGVPVELTVSCYDPDDAGRACGHCDACLLRRDGFARAGISDPTTYR